MRFSRGRSRLRFRALFSHHASFVPCPSRLEQARFSSSLPSESAIRGWGGIVFRNVCVCVSVCVCTRALPSKVGCGNGALFAERLIKTVFRGGGGARCCLYCAAFIDSLCGLSISPGPHPPRFSLFIQIKPCSWVLRRYSLSYPVTSIVAQPAAIVSSPSLCVLGGTF